MNNLSPRDAQLEFGIRSTQPIGSSLNQPDSIMRSACFKEQAPSPRGAAVDIQNFASYAVSFNNDNGPNLSSSQKVDFNDLKINFSARDDSEEKIQSMTSTRLGEKLRSLRSLEKEI